METHSRWLLPLDQEDPEVKVSQEARPLTWLWLSAGRRSGTHPQTTGPSTETSMGLCCPTLNIIKPSHVLCQTPILEWR